jgi:hypothetical protein
VTVDVVVAGSGGFIGRWLTSVLADRGVGAVDVRDFAAGSDTARLLVNLATIHDDPAADLGLIDERITLLGSRAGHWLQTQSFGTLHGRGTLQLSEFNAGFAPTVIDLYGIGKLVEERRLTRAAAAGEVSAVTFAYLPAVLDEGGSWACVRERARSNGYVLPRRIMPSARANFVYIADLVDLVVAWLAKSDFPTVSRLILNDPLSRTTTWPEFLGPMQLSPRHGDPAAALKRAARNARLMASARRLGAETSPDRLDRIEAKTPPAASARPPQPVDVVEPVEFSGVIHSMVRRQGFLEPTSYA